jgi:hypothetical protein
MDTYNPKIAKKEKSRCNVSILAAVEQTLPRQHLKSGFFKNDAFKKETVHEDLRISPEDSPRSQNNACLQ